MSLLPLTAQLGKACAALGRFLGVVEFVVVEALVALGRFLRVVAFVLVEALVALGREVVLPVR